MDTVFHWMVNAILSPFFDGDLPAQFIPLRDNIWSYLKGMILILPCYLVIAVTLYVLAVVTRGKSGAARFSYSLPIDVPGDRLSVRGALRYVLPPAIYTHPSFRIDMMWIPFSLTLRLLGLLTLAVGTGAVVTWLQDHFGGAPLQVPDGGLAIALQVVILLVARDFSRFCWHYQAHMVPFFWEFHKVHHSAEVLHPFRVRTHPVDLFIRNSYMGVGGACIAGGLIYLFGMSYSAQAANVFAGIVGALHLIEHFEHSHVSLSFGKYLGQFFYAPYLHQFHHGASPEHRSVNLGLAGGLTVWDRMFGTLYWPKDGEKIVWGASTEELGENNPHRTLWGLFWSPFVGAFRTLRRSPAQTA
jgi:sterol desaturase/sphingolipid hydroxylase (fatty acid hydroxylase superfamily)